MSNVVIRCKLGQLLHVQGARTDKEPTGVAGNGQYLPYWTPGMKNAFDT